MYGLPANRMMGFNGHPVVVVNRPAGPGDFVSGSGRASRWFDIITSLEQHDGLSAIGHQQARVLRVAKDEKLGHLVAVPQETARVALLAVSTDGPKGDLVLGPDADCDAGPQDPCGRRSSRCAGPRASRPSGTASPRRSSRSKQITTGA
ncbi:hypothetical protein [Streptomyces toxytricini]|uniref:hypothetical protein n=1 Tax=Streptomyces toxytricini TaxID=67369 RepID=UPI0034284CE9